MKFRPLYLALPILLLAGFGCSKSTTTTTSDQAAVGAPSGPSAGNPPAAGTVTPPGTGTPSSGDGRTVSIALRAKSTDQEWGTAVLTDLAGNQTRIVLTLANAPKDEAQTAAIYNGACNDSGAQAQYELNPVVKGSSTTTLNVNLTSLLDKTPQSIRVKASSVDAMAPWANCGNLN